MFHVDLTFEDCRIVASSSNGKKYLTTVTDNFTGEQKAVQLTSKQLAMVFAINMDCNGEPEGFEGYYAELEPVFAGWPNNLRPIP